MFSVSFDLSQVSVDTASGLTKQESNTVLGAGKQIQMLLHILFWDVIYILIFSNILKRVFSKKNMNILKRRHEHSHIQILLHIQMLLHIIFWDVFFQYQILKEEYEYSQKTYIYKYSYSNAPLFSFEISYFENPLLIHILKKEYEYSQKTS